MPSRKLLFWVHLLACAWGGPACLRSPESVVVSPESVVVLTDRLCPSPVCVGHCVRWFRVLLTNSTCVSLSWSLLDNSSAPLSMVVQWSPHRQPESGRPRAQGGETWARLPYVDHPVYLRGSVFSPPCLSSLLSCVSCNRGQSVTLTWAHGRPFTSLCAGRAPPLWNSLPIEIEQATSLSVKHLLKFFIGKPLWRIHTYLYSNFIGFPSVP